MLALSGLSGLSYSSAGLSQDVELELVEQIIDRAPRSATTFPLVYKSYGEVLEENGLSPASDTVYYQFLLKLGVIRAPTWGERWDLWKATNTIKSRPQTSPRKLRNRDDVSRSAEIRARLPFLASASSDLDEGFEGDAESVVGDMIRPSPRKEIYRDKSKTMVGHVPSPSSDYDATTLDVPFRTSTPLRGRGRSTPPLPPYSESDISVSSAIDRHHDEPSTPKAAVHDLESDVDFEDEDMQEMERQADQFYETGLRGRCWDVWAAASDWVQKTTLQIDTVRDNILLRQTLARWRAVHRRQLDLPNTADAHRDHHLKSAAISTWLLRLRQTDLQYRAQDLESRQKDRDLSRCWAHWRNKLIKKRTEQWAQDMASREKSFLARKEEMFIARILDQWRYRTLDSANGRLADSHYGNRQKRFVLHVWRFRTDQKQELDVREEAFAGKQRSIMLSSCLGAWRQETQLRLAERLFASKSATRQMRQAWDEWAAKVSQRQSALELFEKHSLRRALNKWMTVRQRIKTMEHRVEVIRASSDAIILRRAFDSWAISERAQLLRSVYDGRIAKRCFQKWRARVADQAQLDHMADDYAKQLEERRCSSALSRWRDASGRRQKQTLQADLVYEGRELVKSFRTWSAAGKRISANEAVADNAHRFFTQRTVLQCWKAAYEQRKQNAWIAQRETSQLRDVFDFWMDATVQAVDDRRAVVLFRQKADTRIMRDVIGHWTRRVVDLKSRELDVAEKRDSALMRDALSRWTASNRRVKELKGLMHSFRDVKMEESLRGVLRSWQELASLSRQRKVALAQADKERAANLMKETFGRWRSRHRDRCLQPVEEEVALRREDAIIFGAWDTWKARSKKLHAVSMDSRRVKRMAWTRWQRAVELAVQAKQAKASADRHLLGEVFATWKDAAKQKASRKTTRIRGRIRPSSHMSQSRPMSSTPIRRVTPSYKLERDRDRTSIRGEHGSVSPAISDTRGPESVVSEPAYSRLRSELAGRRTGASEESEVEGGNEVLRALRGALGRPA